MSRCYLVSYAMKKSGIIATVENSNWIFCQECMILKLIIINHHEIFYDCDKIHWTVLCRTAQLCRGRDTLLAPNFNFLNLVEIWKCGEYYAWQLVSSRTEAKKRKRLHCTTTFFWKYILPLPHRRDKTIHTVPEKRKTIPEKHVYRLNYIKKYSLLYVLL